jgi:hypothetical protein
MSPEDAEGAKKNDEERFEVASESHASEKVAVSYGARRVAAIT